MFPSHMHLQAVLPSEGDLRHFACPAERDKLECMVINIYHIISHIYCSNYVKFVIHVNIK